MTEPATGEAPAYDALHADARAVLSAWTPADDEQAALRADYLAFLDAHPDAMRRACVPGHLTASTLVLSADRAEVLLTLHRKVGLWLQTGGHCEEGDRTLRAAALREATEESGIAGLVVAEAPVRLDRHRVGCHGGSWDPHQPAVPFGAPGACWHLDVQYVATAPAESVHVRSEESLDLAWFPVDALPELTDEALRRLVRAATG